MSFMTLPEINSLRMFFGAGSAPMLEAAEASFLKGRPQML